MTRTSQRPLEPARSGGSFAASVRSSRQLARLVAWGALAWSVASVGCAPHDAPGLCRGQGDCDKDTACIVGRCRPRAEPVVAAEARRVVLEPIEVALLSSKERERVDVPAIGFGRVSAGDVVMLLSFDDTLGSEVEIDHAFLVLEPVEGAPSPFAPVPIEVAPILEEWSRESVSWGRRPEIGLGEKVADAAPRARRSLRVEVTRMIEETRGRHGIAVLASGQDPIGAFYATGLGRGTAPRLELYLKPTEPAKPAPSASTAPSASAAPKAGSPAASASADEGDDVPAPRSTPKRRPPVPKKPASHR